MSRNEKLFGEILLITKEITTMLVVWIIIGSPVSYNFPNVARNLYQNYFSLEKLYLTHRSDFHPSHIQTSRSWQPLVFPPTSRWLNKRKNSARHRWLITSRRYHIFYPTKYLKTSMQLPWASKNWQQLVQRTIITSSSFSALNLLWSFEGPTK